MVSAIDADSFGYYLLQRLHEHGFSISGVTFYASGLISVGIPVIGSLGHPAVISTLGAHQLLDIGIVEQHGGEFAYRSELLLGGNFLLTKLTPLDVLPCV